MKSDGVIPLSSVAPLLTATGYVVDEVKSIHIEYGQVVMQLSETKDGLYRSKVKHFSLTEG